MRMENQTDSKVNAEEIKKETEATGQILLYTGLASGAVCGFCNAQGIPLQSLESILLYAPALARAGYQAHVTYKAFRGKLGDALPEEARKGLEELKTTKVTLDEKNMRVYVNPAMSQRTLDAAAIGLGGFAGGIVGGLHTAVGYAAGYIVGRLTR